MDKIFMVISLQSGVYSVKPRHSVKALKINFALASLLTDLCLNCVYFTYVNTGNQR